jgi:hypothetical protein
MYPLYPVRETAQLAEVIAEAFGAAGYGTDPAKVTQLATRAIAPLLPSQPKVWPPPPWPSFCFGELV